MKKELLAKRAALTTELDAMIKLAVKEDRDFTEAEEKREAEIKVELATVNKQLARIDENDARMAVLDAPAGTAQSRHIDPASPAAAGPEAKKNFENVGEFFAVVGSKKDDARVAALYAEQSMQDGTTGGIMIPTQYNNGEILQITPQGAVFRNHGATTISGGGSTPDAEQAWPVLNQSTSNAAAPAHVYGGVVVGESAEAVAAALTGFKLKQMRTKPQETTGAIIVNNKLLRNWGAASQFIPRQLDQALSGHENRRCFFGDGVGKALGALVSPACITVARDTASHFKYADAVAMVSKLLMRGGSPFWAFSQSVMPDLLKMIDDEGHLVWQPNAREGVPSSLLGYPIEWVECLPILGVKSDVSLINAPYYFVHDGFGPMVASSDQLKFLEGQTVFKIVRSMDGQPWMDAPFAQEGGSYEVSPFITLGDHA